MPKRINNNIDLKLLVNKQLNKAIGYVMDRIYENYSDIIEDVVYNSYDPLEYDRTYDLKNSFKTDVSETWDTIVGSLSQDVDSMSVNVDKFQHGNPSSGDLREYIADMVINGYGYYFDKDNLQNKEWSEPRDFWSPLIEVVNENIDQWFREGCYKNGLVIK